MADKLVASQIFRVVARAVRDAALTYSPMEEPPGWQIHRTIGTVGTRRPIGRAYHGAFVTGPICMCLIEAGACQSPN